MLAKIEVYRQNLAVADFDYFTVSKMGYFLQWLF